jgi:uncharacterized membrane protein YebE (DUF533 family)
MGMRRRRRPLLRGAMLAGTGAVAYHAGKRHEAEQQDESDQDQQPDDMSRDQAAPEPSAPAAQTGTVGELERLKALLDQGALTPAEFDAAKRRILQDT